MAYHVLTLVTTMVLMQTGYDIIPMKFSRVPMNIEDDDAYLRVEAWLNKEYSGVILPYQAADEVINERSYRHSAIEIMYEGGNVFSKENLKSIQALETELTNIDEYASTFCWLRYISANVSNCQKPLSIIRFFDGTFFGNDPNFDNISGILSAAQSNPQMSALLQYHLGKNAVIDAANGIATSEITRSMIFFGTPLSGYNTITDKDDSQFNKIEKFQSQGYSDRLKSLAKDGYGGMDIIYYSLPLFFGDIQTQVKLDLALAGGSFMFILVFMLIQTQSLFKSGLGIFSIMTSFFGANMVYNIVLDYKYFGVFHVLSVFIILGIGADDIFVFHDTWRESGHREYPSLAHRLSDTYRHASVSMAITSFTTMVAFIVNAASPLLAINSFGIFSTLIIIVNYLSVITFFPAVVVVHHLYFEKWTWPCFRSCAKKNEEKSQQSPARKNMIVIFFRGHFFNFVTHKILRFVIILLFIPLLIVFVYYSTQLKPDEESVSVQSVLAALTTNTNSAVVT